MYKIAKCLFLHCQTPMHAGSGSDLGIVDLPIQRESHTGYPKIEASSLKGALREAFEENATSEDDFVKVHLAFGYDNDIDSRVANSVSAKAKFANPDDRDYAGALGFSDARLVLFPLKSLRGIFVYATCPAVLKRLKREVNELCKPTQTLTFDDNIEVDEDKVIAANAANLKISNASNKIQLEEYCFKITQATSNIAGLATELVNLTGVSGLANQLVILHDDVFADFVKMNTEVVTRIKIDNETGTVKGGALFTEEYLPAESVLYSLVLASPIFAKSSIRSTHFQANGKTEQAHVLDYIATALDGSVVQIGGNATLGKGIVKTKIQKEATA